MKLSLSNVFRRLCGCAQAPSLPRPRRTTNLNVESLEERAVPAGLAPVVNHYYNFGALKNYGSLGTLYVTSENMQTGAISGYFECQTNQNGPNTFSDLPITGVLSKPVGSSSPITFHSPSNGLHSQVSFQGSVANDASTMQGTLTEQSAVTMLWEQLAGGPVIPYPSFLVSAQGFEIPQ
jgi:hypothetical protein